MCMAASCDDLANNEQIFHPFVTAVGCGQCFSIDPSLLYFQIIQLIPFFFFFTNFFFIFHFFFFFFFYFFFFFFFQFFFCIIIYYYVL